MGDVRDRRGPTGPGGPAAALEFLDEDSGMAPVPPMVHRTSRRRHRVWGVGIAIVVALLTIGATTGGWFSPSPGPSSAGGCPTGLTILGEGGSFILPLMSAWARGYENDRGNLVNYNPAGSGAGIVALSDRQVDFASTDEPLTPAEGSTMPGPVLTLPAVGGALAIVYHLDPTSAPLRLNGSVLAGIYLGVVTAWDDPEIASLNPGVVLPAKPIVAVHRSDAAGATQVLTEYLASASSAWRGGPGVGLQPKWPSAPAQQAQPGNSKLAEYVGATWGTIGYTDVSDAVATPGLRIAAMGNPSGQFLEPTISDTASAIAHLAATTTWPMPSGSWANVSLVDSPSPGDYPLVAFAYLLVVGPGELGFEPSALRSTALFEWLDWVTTTGQNLTAPFDDVALPPAILAIDRAAISSMAFEGRSVACPSR